MNKELLDACYDVWRLGYKREKGLAHCAKLLGYKPLVTDYVEHFKYMFDTHCK
ncbi:hypothetical protein VPDG_00083 [Vibrio phage henriette 12B8]|uniref:hypothetical protein n=1 Tax=Vibrio phage henriette 12B8 TaxID=573174 RepID=UPI0002C07BFA|nr:hypothetical protein VPDG_00083 [Vibrio phage henriette 12B8]AGG58244.1 hypothetical protein VPDG_00083 [Vibrio phage henriette 12B8]